MSILDGALHPIEGAPDTVIGLAQQIGLDASRTEQAVALLAQCHLAHGDTIELAARKSGLDRSVLTEIVAKLGGEGALRAIATHLSGGLGDLGQWTLREELALMFPRLFGQKT